MFEVRVTISAPELAQAINNLAAALVGVKPQQAAPADGCGTFLMR